MDEFKGKHILLAFCLGFLVCMWVSQSQMLNNRPFGIGTKTFICSEVKK